MAYRRPRRLRDLFVCAKLMPDTRDDKLRVLGKTRPCGKARCKIEGKAMIRNRHNYPTSPIRDIKGKETRTRNNRTLMETSPAESQTDSYFLTKCPHGYPNQKDVSDTHIQRRTITKINHDRTGVGEGGRGPKWILRGHNPRPYFCGGLDIQFVQSA